MTLSSRNLPAIVAKPAAENLPTPFGDLSAASIDDIADAASEAWLVAHSTADKNRLAIRHFLGRLQHLPGMTWQQRWEAAGFDDCRVMMPEWNPPKSVTATQAVRMLAGLRVVSPSLLALRRNTLVDYAEGFRQAQRDPLLDEFTTRVNASALGRAHQRRAVNDIAYALTTQRIGMTDLSAEAFMHYIHQWRLTAPTPTSDERYTGQLAWEVLHAMGHFGPRVPATLRLAINGLKLDVADMVDNQGRVPPDIRQLFIDYVEHRRADGMDYSSLRNLVRKLVGNFWLEIVQINPDQTDLRIPPEVYAEWRRRLAVLPNGKPRITVYNILFAVRALYLDLHSWAVNERERWARWVAPCPVPDNDRRGYSTGRQRQIERMADRTRRLQPLVGLLSAHVTDRLQWHRDLLQQARGRQARRGVHLPRTGTATLLEPRGRATAAHIRQGPAAAAPTPGRPAIQRRSHLHRRVLRVDGCRAAAPDWHAH
ncbi:hypothetical protein ACWIF8_01630 [Micromonospora chalcea]